MTTNNQGVGTRELALMILLEIERGEKSHIVLRQVLEKYQYLSKQDRAFLTRLAEGTTERRIELDYIINQFSKVKTEKMKNNKNDKATEERVEELYKLLKKAMNSKIFVVIKLIDEMK